ncbi:MAG: S1 family peptidase [Caulobacteraceae bacterium]
MKLPRPPDWLFYLGVVAALTLAAVGIPLSERGARAPTIPAGQPLAPASLFDPAIWVSAPPPGPGAGTAFSVADRGVWLTARHVVEGCGRTVIVTAPGHGVAATVRLTPGRETAILFTRGGAPALPIAPKTVLKRGERAYDPGFPRERPGEVASELLRRATLLVGWRGLRAEPVLTFAETGRSPPGRGSAAGISGAPVLDREGRVLGVTVAENPRRRRLYTTTPASLRAALAAAGVTPSDAAGEALTQGSWRDVSDDLRGALSVVEVECLAR